MIVRKLLEWSTDLPEVLTLDVSDLDTAFVQATMRQVPTGESVTLAVEVSVDGSYWVDCSAIGFNTPPTIIIDDGSTYGTSNAFPSYKINPYRYVRVRQTAATTNAGRVLVTLGASKAGNAGKKYRVDSIELADPINANSGYTVAVDGRDSAGFQVSPSIVGGWSGTLTLKPEVTYDGEGWVQPYLTTDRVSSGVTNTSFTGTSKIGSHVNVLGASAFRVRTTGAAPTGSANLSLFVYNSIYGPALEAAAKGV